MADIDKLVLNGNTYNISDSNSRSVLHNFNGAWITPNYYWGDLNSSGVITRGYYKNLTLVEPIPINYGDSIYVNTQGYGVGHPWYIVDDDYNVLIESGDIPRYTGFVTVTSALAKYLLVNISNSFISDAFVLKNAKNIPYDAITNDLFDKNYKIKQNYYWTNENGYVLNNNHYQGLSGVYPINIKYGDKIYIRTKGYSAGYSYYIVDSKYQLLTSSGNADVIDDIIEVTNQDASLLLVNVYSSVTDFKVVKLSNSSLFYEMPTAVKTLTPDIISGYIDYETGIYGSFTDSGKLACTSSYIDVHGYKKCYAFVGSRGSMDGVAFYKIDKTFISGFPSSKKHFDIPSNAFYMRFSDYNENGDHSAVYCVLSDYEDAVKVICCTGDSVTEGMGTIGHHTAQYNASPYPARLATILYNNGYRSFDVVNQGHGGERIPDVCARVGAYPCIFTEDVVIPSDGSNVSLGVISISGGRINGTKIKIPYKDTNNNDFCVFFTQQAYDTNPVTIDGIQYTLTASDTEDKIKKLVNDNTVTTIKQGSLLFTNNYRSPYVNIIYAGYNDGQSLTLSEWIDTMLACGATNGNRFIILGSTHAIWNNWSDLAGTSEQKYEKYLFESNKAFGTHFIDLYKEFFDHAMDYALEAGYFTDKTSAQIANMRNLLAQHIVPAEFSYNKESQGNVHLSEEGYHVVAMLIYERLKTLNYV